MHSHIVKNRVLLSTLVLFVFTSLTACHVIDNSQVESSHLTAIVEKADLFPASSLLISPELMLENKGKYGDLRKSSQLKALVIQAEKYLGLTPPTITNKSRLPDSGEANDYMSIGPYWWPNTQTKDGLPWIRKDGEVNPITQNANSDKSQLRLFTKALKTLGYAYYYTGDQRFSAKAQELLEVWFVNKSTRMAPNLNFAQSVPGRSSGRGFGIIEFVELPHILDVIFLLKTELSSVNTLALKSWFQDFTQWMKKSKNGKEESNAQNNHGSFYLLLMVSLHSSLGQEDEAIAYVDKAKVLLAKQIDVDGKQPHELARTKPFNYSIYNLRALFSIAKIAERFDENLWFEASSSSNNKGEYRADLRPSKLHSALAYIFKLSPTNHNQDQWQGLQKYKVDYTRMVSLVSLSSHVYPKFVRSLSALPKNHAMSQQIRACNLLFGKIPTAEMPLNVELKARERLAWCVL